MHQARPSARSPSAARRRSGRPGAPWCAAPGRRTCGRAPAPPRGVRRPRDRARARRRPAPPRVPGARSPARHAFQSRWSPSGGPHQLSSRSPPRSAAARAGGAGRAGACRAYSADDLRRLGVIAQQTPLFRFGPGRRPAAGALITGVQVERRPAVSDDARLLAGIGIARDERGVDLSGSEAWLRSARAAADTPWRNPRLRGHLGRVVGREGVERAGRRRRPARCRRRRRLRAASSHRSSHGGAVVLAAVAAVVVVAGWKRTSSRRRCFRRRDQQGSRQHQNRQDLFTGPPSKAAEGDGVAARWGRAPDGRWVAPQCEGPSGLRSFPAGGAWTPRGRGTRNAEAAERGSRGPHGPRHADGP